MSPPLTNLDGILRRAAAMNMPGIILSQLGMRTEPSKAWAKAIASMESAISFQLASGYFIHTVADDDGRELNRRGVCRGDAKFHHVCNVSQTNMSGNDFIEGIYI